MGLKQLPLIILFSLLSFGIHCHGQRLPQAQFDKLMSMSLNDFDQTEEGWRQYKENIPLMIHLVKNYIQRNNVNDATLNWHLGQLYALNNENEKAVVEMAKTLRPLSDEEVELNKSWNYYVLGTIAFLKNDSRTLSSYIDSLANNPITMNIEVLRRLQVNIGKSYKNSY